MTPPRTRALRPLSGIPPFDILVAFLHGRVEGNMGCIGLAAVARKWIQAEAEQIVAMCDPASRSLKTVVRKDLWVRVPRPPL